VADLRGLLEVSNERLSAEQLRLADEVRPLQDRLDSVMSLNRSHEATIAEQQSRIEKLIADSLQVSVTYCRTNYH